jgi:putative nucleotidyltransferase with HDIG domain
MENTSYIDEQRLQVIREYIDKMPSLSTTVTKVLEICNRPNTEPNDLNKVISIDPVLTGNVLKLINSAYYSLPNQVTSLGRAIIMLGINTVKNLALSTAILGTLKSSGELQSLPMDTFWAHGLCVGVAAKSIAAGINIPITQHEEFFVAGLLHDLGKVALNNCFPQEYSQAMALAELDQGPLYRAEETILGLQHALAGQRIAEKWQFGKTIIQTIAFHHRPKAASEDVQEMVAIVALANIYANIYAYGSAGDMFPSPIDLAEVLDMVGMNWRDMQHLEETVSTEIEKAKIFLQIGAGKTS